MSETEAEGSGRRFTIFVNDNRYQVEQASMTGSEIKALDSIPSGNSLFLEVPGPDPDRKIEDTEAVDLRSGMRFYDLPPIQRGDRFKEELDLLGKWYPKVVSEPVPEGIWVSVPIQLPSGWQSEDPRIGVITPVEFPRDKPAGFWVTTPLANPNGAEVGSQRQVGGRDWANVCWQVQAWDPSRERLWRYFKGMERWFVEGWN